MHFLYALAFAVLLAIVDREFPNAEALWSERIIDSAYYVDVRNNSHMFYWFYYTSHPDGYQRRPWIIWLQGGPGGSSCGYGNFGIIGPRKKDLTSRNTTWVKQASILFIDAPVGAGFSYVDDPSAYNTEISHVIDDLMEVLRVFLKRIPVFKTRPVYIFGQSYGGKFAAYLARRLYDDIQTGKFCAKLVGFAMGNAWISPLDSVLNYADFVYWMSVVDENGRDRVREQVGILESAIAEGNSTEAVKAFFNTLDAINNASNHVDVYDISKFSTAKRETEDSLDKTMEHLKKTTLRMVPTNVNWSDFNWDVFYKLGPVFMKPSIGVVDDLLKTTDLQVIVYQGQLDIICNNKGAMDWVQNFTWSNLTFYNSAERKAFRNPADNQTEFFVKAFGKFKFYTVLGAGHAVPRDKGGAAYRMLDRILNNMDQ